MRIFFLGGIVDFYVYFRWLVLGLMFFFEFVIGEGDETVRVGLYLLFRGSFGSGELVIVFDLFFRLIFFYLVMYCVYFLVLV